MHVESADPFTLITIGSDPRLWSSGLAGEVTQIIDNPEIPFSGIMQGYVPTNTEFDDTAELNPEA